MTQEITALVSKTLVLFPVRVWRHFLAKNGLLLASGIGYQALFALFAAVYVGFSIAGIWLAGRPETLAALVGLVNTYVPGVIGENGIVNFDDVMSAATSRVGVLTLTGIIAAVGLIWTAIGWMTFSRMAVRTVFGLEKDTRAYVLLKARDLIVALIFGAMLFVAATLSVASTFALDSIFALFGFSTTSLAFEILLRSGGLLIIFVIDTLFLAATFRFLSRAALRWRRLWPGSLLGGGALLALQLVGSWLAGRTPSNPLLASFAAFIGLLLFFRLVAVVTLVAASWIAVGAGDQDESLRAVGKKQLQREKRQAENRALLLAAHVRVREAQSELERARWFERPAASRRLKSLEQEVELVKARTRDE